jgi:multidrug resistance efflux pump
MKKLFVFFIFVIPAVLIAKVHYAKVEPYESATIKASVSGTVLKADYSLEGSMLGDEAFVQIDDLLDRENLKNTQESLELFSQNLKINEQVLEGLKSTLDRRKEYYERINDLETASKTQKDNAFAAYIGAKNQYLGTQEKITTLKKQIIDLRYKASILKDSISKKHIAFPGKYLYHLMVHQGEFVAPGVPVAAIYDISKAKVVVFLDREEIKQIKEKKIFIDDKETDLGIEKLWKVADSQYISSYKAKITLPTKYQFSKLLKIEFK